MEIYGGDEKGVYQGFQSVGELILHKLKESGDKTALIDGVTSESRTYSELRKRSLHIANAMKQKFGISKGDVVTIVSENSLEFPAVVFGTLLLNATMAPCNLTYSEREIEHALNLSKPKLIFASPFALDKVLSIMEKFKFVEKVVLLSDFDLSDGNPSVILIDDFLKDVAASEIRVDPINVNEHMAVILCSSGTTGLPKGVQITHANLMAAIEMCQETIYSLASSNDQKTLLLIIPMFQAFGFFTHVGTLVSARGVLVFLPRFEPEQFLNSIQEHKINVVMVVPALMVFLAKSPLFDDYDLSSLQEIFCGAAPLKPYIEESVRKRMNNGVIIRQGYGMTESSLAIIIQQHVFKPGSVGSVIPGQIVKIVDETGKSLGPNQEGELCFKGTQRMFGYINNDEATKFTIDKDGWLHTGDCAYYDEDKQFYIIERYKELIKYKGFQVPPAEIEELLLQHPAIEDAGVVGLEDEEAGELAMAFVVKKPDVEVTEDEIKKFIAKQASKPKQLHGGVRFIDELPKNLLGKILRRELRALLKTTQPLKAKL